MDQDLRKERKMFKMIKAKAIKSIYNQLLKKKEIQYRLLKINNNNRQAKNKFDS